MLIRIVDDDTDLTESLKFFLEAEGWQVSVYNSAEEYLINDAPSVDGCLVLDVRMNGLSGLELQEEMQARGLKVPIIFLTGHGDIDMAVQAMRYGAKDFLQKPVRPEKLIQSITRVTNEIREKKEYGNSLEFWREKIALLTDREKEVITLSAEGLLNQDISRRLSISTRTVHAHRLNSYKKLGIHSLNELASISEILKKETK